MREQAFNINELECRHTLIYNCRWRGAGASYKSLTGSLEKVAALIDPRHIGCLLPQVVPLIKQYAPPLSLAYRRKSTTMFVLWNLSSISSIQFSCADSVARISRTSNVGALGEQGDYRIDSANLDEAFIQRGFATTWDDVNISLRRKWSC